MKLIPYELDGRAEARLGLVVLQVDETIEGDFRRLLPEGVTLHVTRVPSDRDLTAETIGRMAHDLPRAVSLLPSPGAYDAVGYACTSGTVLIGVERVARLVRGECQARAVCDPLSAAVAAFRHLGVGRIGLVSPYLPGIAEDVRRAFDTWGIAVPVAASFGERVEANVARIAPGSVAAAVRNLAASGEVEAIFVSCTNLRILDLLVPLGRELGLPVLASNLVLAWAMLRETAARRGLAPLDLIGRARRGQGEAAPPAQS